MKKLLILLVAVLLLSGCPGIGAMGGGASYSVDLTKPDGTVLNASADSIESSESVVFSMARDKKTGLVETITFSKTAATPGVWSNAVLESVLEKIPAAAATAAALP